VSADVDVDSYGEKYNLDIPRAVLTCLGALGPGPLDKTALDIPLVCCANRLCYDLLMYC